ncbi:MAG: hypothetical protein WD053_02150 [Gracilimonas sp.]
MWLIILLIAFGLFYLFFLKKGSGGESFYNYSNQTSQSVKESGGMMEKYETYFDKFRSFGFTSDKITSTSLHMFKESSLGRIEFDIIQSGPSEATLALESKLNNKPNHSATLKIFEDSDPEENINSLIQEYCIVDGDSQKIKQPEINFYTYLKSDKQEYMFVHLFSDNPSKSFQENTYDKNGNIISRRTNHSDGTFHENQFEYKNNKVIKKYSKGRDQFGEFKDLREIYEYDINGNILRETTLNKGIIDDEVIEHLYLYDEQDKIRYLKMFKDGSFQASKPILSISDFEAIRLDKKEIIENNLILKQYNEKGDVLRKVYPQNDKVVIDELVDEDQLIGVLHDYSLI